MEQIKQLIWSFISGMTDQDRINHLNSIIQWAQRRIDIIQQKHSFEFAEVIADASEENQSEENNDASIPE